MGKVVGGVWGVTVPALEFDASESSEPSCVLTVAANSNEQLITPRHVGGKLHDGGVHNLGLREPRYSHSGHPCR